MQLTFTEEQIAARDALERMVGDAVQSNMPDRDLWRAMADAGWLRLSVPESHGGYGGTSIDAGLLARVLGYHGRSMPFISSILLGAGGLACASPNAGADWMEAVLLGQKLAALAHQEGTSFDPDIPSTRAVRISSGWRISGTKHTGAGGGNADLNLVSATLEDGDFALFALLRDQEGARARRRAGVNGQEVCTLEIESEVPDAALLARGGDLRQRLSLVIDNAISGICWEVEGAMRSLFEITRDYTALRKQFGRAISDFQVVQHRLAEMALCCEEAQAAAELAALRIGAAPAVRRRAVSAAKLRIGAAARFVAHEAVQLHGAVGTTEEVAVARRFRQILAFHATLGSSRAHAARYASCVLPEGAHARSAVLEGACKTGSPA
jgi:alkylation response protein AidB-like acyl-CoA dehydrogenase